MLSPKAKRNLARIIPFGIIWLLSGLVFLIVEQAATGGSGQTPTGSIEMDLSVFIFSSLAITAVGLLVGTVELLYLHDAFAQQSFTRKIVYKLLLYGLLIFLITLITFPIAAALELNTSILDRRVWDKLLVYLTSAAHLSTNVQLGVALGASLFYAEISDNIGHSVLMNFFTGKYHQPTEENRIFMFLDMKSSTTIAEQLGHITYFQLLRDYYADLSEAIVRHSGEVYQYVGDEIIVSWKYQDGRANDHCLACFFAMKKDLEARGGHYRQKYGLCPTFKAGLHFGKVTTGEIGVVKKDIIFTGDVLNATARIQGLCNTYRVDILISAELADQLQPASHYQLRSMGRNELRGKTEALELFTVASKAIGA